MSLENDVKNLIDAVKELTEAIRSLTPDVAAAPSTQVPVPMGPNFSEPFTQPPTTGTPPPEAQPMTGTPVPPAPTGEATNVTTPPPPQTAAVPPPPPAADAAPATPPPVEVPEVKNPNKVVTKKRAKELSDKMVDIAKNLGTSEPVAQILHSFGVGSTADLTNAQAHELEKKLDVL